MSGEAPLLEVRDLERRFGAVRAVDRLSFRVERGSVTGFIGPNGAGKTTTMRLIATLDLPHGGEAWVEGYSVLAEPRAVRERIGFMPDVFTPYAHLLVSDYLEFFGRSYGLRGAKLRDRIAQVAAFCGLEPMLDRPSTGLSKGMAQRLHLAKTLLHDPALLVLDEPTAGLDPRARIELRELLRSLAAAGKGVLISSHILSELSEICDAVVVIEAGRLIVSGRVDEVAARLREHHPVRVRLLPGRLEEAERFFLTQPLVRELRSIDARTLVFDFTGDEAALSELLGRAFAAGMGIVSFQTEEVDLEEVFLRSTEGRLQ